MSNGSRCSFCGESRRTAERLVIGHDGVAICAHCARLAVDLSSAGVTEESGDLLIRGIGVLVTNDLRQGGLLGCIEGAAVAIKEGRVTWLGRERSVPAGYHRLPELDCGGAMVSPGFVDAHRHLDHDGSIDLDGARDQASALIGTLLEQGVTSMDLRTAGAADPREEVTLLSGIRAAADLLPTTVTSSMMVGTTPPERGPKYISLLETVLIPAAAGVVDRIDVVLGEAFGWTGAAVVAAAARRRGLGLRVHGDKPEAVEFAIDVGATSIDGMAGMEQAAEAIAESGIPVVDIPMETWSGHQRSPAQALWEAGVTVAIGTGCRAGSLATIPLAMAVAVHHGGVSSGRALWSATRGGSLALGNAEGGVVRTGAIADLVVLNAERPRDLVAEPGRDPVRHVIKQGAILGT